MRAHIIERDGNTVLFLPDSMKFYKINHITKEIIEQIEAAKPEKEILDEYHISNKEYDELYRLLSDNEAVQEVTAKREDVLYKLVLNVANACNLSCKYCYANGGSYCSEETMMSVETARKTLNVFLRKYKNIKVIQFFGGEPTLNVEVIEFVCEYFQKRWQSHQLDYLPEFGIITNGTNVKDRLTEIINKYHIHVTVSLDGPSKVNDKARVFNNGKGTSEVIVKNINKMKRCTNQPEAVEVTYNCMHINEEMSVKDTVKYIKDELNIGQIHLVPVSVDQDSEFLLKDRTAFTQSVSDIFTEKRESGKDYGYSLINRVVRALKAKKTNKYLCEAGISVYAVSVSGDVYPCFMLIDQPEFKLGNVYDDELFATECFSDKTQQLEQFSKFTDTRCKSCFNNRICSGCLGSNYFKTGDIHKTEETDCQMYRELTERVIVELAREC